MRNGGMSAVRTRGYFECVLGQIGYKNYLFLRAYFKDICGDAFAGWYFRLVAVTLTGTTVRVDARGRNRFVYGLIRADDVDIGDESV